MRSRLLVLVLVCAWYEVDAGAVAAPFPDDCAAVCSSGSDCNTPCFENFMQFENGNWSSCGDYEVCGYTSYCGDNNCDHLNPIYSEAPGNCPQDCGELECVPDYVTDWEPYAAYYDEHCIPIGKESDGAATSDSLSNDGLDYYWCECTHITSYIHFYHDLNHCLGSTESYSCADGSPDGYFEDYANDLGYCCATNPSGCWGDSCPY